MLDFVFDLDYNMGYKSPVYKNGGKKHMGFLEAKCPNCGAKLEVDDTKGRALCYYCGTEFIVERALMQSNVDQSKDFKIVCGVLEEYLGASQNVSIPEGVIEIKEGVFAEKEIDTLTIPKSLRCIKGNAFYECYVEKIVYNGTIDDWCKIGFWDTPFYFFDHQGGEFIVNGTPVEKTITIGDVGDIWQYAFWQTVDKLKEVYFSKPLKSIGSHCFEFTDIEKANVEQCHGFIGTSAFHSTPLKEVTINAESICEKAFSNCYELERIVFGDNVKVIGEKAFADCKKLKEIIWGKNIEYICDCAFENCTELTHASLPASLKGCAASSFKNCTSINEVDLEYMPSEETEENVDLNAYSIYNMLICAKNIEDIFPTVNIVNILSPLNDVDFKAALASFPSYTVIRYGDTEKRGKKKRLSMGQEVEISEADTTTEKRTDKIDRKKPLIGKFTFLSIGVFAVFLTLTLLKIPFMSTILLFSGIVEAIIAFIIFKRAEHVERYVCPQCGERREHHREYIRTESKDSQVSSSGHGYGRKTDYQHVYNDTYICPKCGETKNETIKLSGGQYIIYNDGFIYDHRLGPKEF